MEPAIRADADELRPPRRRPRGRWLAAAALGLGLIAAGAWWWWASQADAPPPLPVAAAPAALPPPPPSSSTADAPRHPIEAAPAASAATGDGPTASLADAVTELVGRNVALAMLNRDNLVQRIVATVDNLDRSHAAPRLWPVVPTPGRFSVAGNGQAQTIAPDNAARYVPLVAFVESLDMNRLAAIYVRHYAEFEAAYRDLGYPKGRFNDRLVVVIDRLLATPEPSGPPAMHLTDVKGPVPAERPWVRYEFSDPALDALPAGSKMLLRAGPDNTRRLKAKLRQLRAAVARAP